MSEITEHLAAKTVDKIIEDANGGETYAPCFRDCLYDNRETAQTRIAEAIEAATKSAWVYEAGRENMRVFATEEAAQRWFTENDPEGVAFEHPVEG